MAVATLMIGFKFDNINELHKHFRQAYFYNAGVNKNPDFYTSNNESSEKYKYKVFKGSIYENWYGWTDEQKRSAYKNLYDKQRNALLSAIGWINAESNSIRIRTFNRSGTASQKVIIGIPIVEITDDNNHYGVITSQIPSVETDAYYEDRDNCVKLQLTDTQLQDFKQLVYYLKTKNRPTFYIFNSTGSDTTLSKSSDDINIPEEN